MQCRVHLGKGAVGLREEVVDDGFAEFALLFVVVHFEDLFRKSITQTTHFHHPHFCTNTYLLKRRRVDRVPKVRHPRAPII